MGEFSKAYEIYTGFLKLGGEAIPELETFFQAKNVDELVVAIDSLYKSNVNLTVFGLTAESVATKMSMIVIEAQNVGQAVSLTDTQVALLKEALGEDFTTLFPGLTSEVDGSRTSVELTDTQIKLLKQLLGEDFETIFPGLTGEVDDSRVSVQLTDDQINKLRELLGAEFSTFFPTLTGQANALGKVVVDADSYYMNLVNHLGQEVSTPFPGMKTEVDNLSNSLRTAIDLSRQLTNAKNQQAAADERYRAALQRRQDEDMMIRQMREDKTRRDMDRIGSQFAGGENNQEVDVKITVEADSKTVVKKVEKSIKKKGYNKRDVIPDSGIFRSRR